MSTVGALLLGALLTLAAQAFLQLYVVPRVETRKRREDRWEKDVRALGELLTGDVARTVRAAMDVSGRLLMAQTALEHPNIKPEVVRSLREIVRDDDQKAREAAQAFADAAEVRVGWLAARVVAIATDEPGMQPLRVAAMLYGGAVLNAEVNGTGFYAVEATDEAHSAMKDAWAREREARKKLLETAAELADRSPPRRRSRVRRRLGAMRGMISLGWSRGVRRKR